MTSSGLINITPWWKWCVCVVIYWVTVVHYLINWMLRQLACIMTSSNGNILRPFVRGIHRSPVNSLHKGKWRGALMMFSLICAWTSGSVNNRYTGDFRRHRAHYDVTVILYNYKWRYLVMGWESWISEWGICAIRLWHELCSRDSNKMKWQFDIVSCDGNIMKRKVHCNSPYRNVHWANMGPTWVLSAPDGPHVGPMNLAIGVNIM